MSMLLKKKLAIIGLGYVGLPLAVEFAKKGFSVTGYDINQNRVTELLNGVDTTEVENLSDLSLQNLKFTYDERDLVNIDIFIVTAPTPVDRYNIPDLSALKHACKLVGAKLQSWLYSSI